MRAFAFAFFLSLPSLAAAEQPQVRVVALPRNVGFGAGNNRGAALAVGRWLLLLNSDAFVQPGAIDELVRFADAHPAVGAAGSSGDDDTLRGERGRGRRSPRTTQGPGPRSKTAWMNRPSGGRASVQ